MTIETDPREGMAVSRAADRGQEAGRQPAHMAYGMKTAKAESALAGPAKPRGVDLALRDLRLKISDCRFEKGPRHSPAPWLPANPTRHTDRTRRGEPARRHHETPQPISGTIRLHRWRSARCAWNFRGAHAPRPAAGCALATPSQSGEPIDSIHSPDRPAPVRAYLWRPWKSGGTLELTFAGSGSLVFSLCATLKILKSE